MALKYQFNKISLHSLRKQLNIREKALPILKSKESALRLTIKKEKAGLTILKEKFETHLLSLNKIERLWAEFPTDIFYLKEVILQTKKTAGIKTPQLMNVNYEIKEFSSFIQPAWLNFGIQILKETAQLLIEIEVAQKRILILEYGRKKTTQKVNLYEKVQIPSYSEAILKIKRFLEDVDNLEKSAQKITKDRQNAGRNE